MDDTRFSILFVCTGNRCRSALAGVIIRSLTRNLPVDVASAGILELPPTPAPEETVRAASTLGYQLGDHRSTPLSEVDASSFDLVIGFELEHLATAVVEHGADSTKTFLLRQLVKLLDEPSPRHPVDQVAAQARLLVARADELRGGEPPRPGDMVADPMGHSARVHMKSARAIDELSRTLVARLFPRRG